MCSNNYKGCYVVYCIFGHNLAHTHDETCTVILTIK